MYLTQKYRFSYLPAKKTSHYLPKIAIGNGTDQTKKNFNEKTKRKMYKK